jgi:two-component system, NarL family, response regulator NreC
MVNIVMADDHAVVRSGLVMILQAQEDWRVVAETGTIPDTLREVRARHPDILVLDLNMPGGSGLEAIPVIREDCPTTSIVVLTMQTDPEYARAALRAGAMSYVLKESASDDLVDAVTAATRGERYINPQLGGLLVAEPAAPEGPPDGLSNREAEVLRMIARGYTNTEIAKDLYVSTRTVESHRAHILQKLRISTRAELVQYAIDHHLFDA